MTPVPALPVVFVAGLHAQARREAVEHLLAALPGSLALHHDLSGATVVRTVRDAGGVRQRGEAPPVDDCPCCAVREDLVPQLRRLAEGRDCALAVVELWDSVEPRAMAEAVAEHAAGALRPAGVVTAVDPALVLPYLACGDDLADVGLPAAPEDRRTVADTWARQLEYATVVAVAHGEDPVSEADLALLTQLHPTARQVAVGDPAFPLLAASGFDAAAAAERQHPASALLPQDAQEYGVGTLLWRHRRPFHPGRLFNALEDLTCAAPRSRGRFWLADRPDTLLSWDAAGGTLSVESAGPWLATLPDVAWAMVPGVRRAAAAIDWHPEFGDRVQLLAFTGPGIDRHGIRAMLASCLLSEAEYAAGRDAWRRLPSAFDALLDPAL
ncbi:CobW family GTP-binding protein [Streptomyces marincola]|uniref:CobW family GTP-binding protein n=1 Tax=Streptomyces marincola TaxID=2878388 RepID=UPI001CF1DCF1|nr:GTP-binding protein [Streptomyces marincola]UCM89473.1 GTP-binding protein [Streptomyces marincola]